VPPLCLTGRADTAGSGGEISSWRTFAVVLEAFESRFEVVSGVQPGLQQGWARVERILRLAFRHFEEQPAFVRVTRREALDGARSCSKGWARR